MAYLAIVILLIVFTWLISKGVLKTNLSKKDLLIGWAIKLLSGVFFMFIISYHFSDNGKPAGDVSSFLHDGRVLNDYAKEHPAGYLKLLIGIDADNEDVLNNALNETRIWDYGITSDLINDNRLIIRINSIIEFISFGNYWVNTLVFAFLSFIGILLLYKSIEPMVQRKQVLFYGLLVFPTIAFWGSGVTKETIFILALGLFFWGLVKLIKKLTFLNALLIGAGILLLLINKPHVGIVVVPLAGFVLVGLQFGFNRKKLIISIAGLCGVFILLCFTPSKVNIVERLSYKQSDFINLAKGGIFFINDSAFCAFDYQDLSHFDYNADGKLIRAKATAEGEYKLFGEKTFHPYTIQPDTTQYDVYLVVEPSETYIDVTPINNEPVQLIKNIPQALFNVLIRPLPTDQGSNFKHLAFLENLAFLSFLVLVFLKRKSLSGIEKAWVFYLCITALALFLIIGWTTPIIGAVVRYKIAPHLLLFLAAMITWSGTKKSTT